MTLVVTSAPWQQVNMPALDLRRYLGVTLIEGVGTGTDLAVAQRGAGANMSVDIAAGNALVQGDSISFQGLYYALNDAVFNLTGFTAAHATLPRIDRVTVRVRDAFHGDAANDISFQIVTGTATSGATLVNLNGAASVPASSLLLANILIPAASSSITTANIDTTVRPLSGGLTTGSVTSAHILDGTIVNADINAAAAIAVAKIAPGSNGQLLMTVTGATAWAAAPPSIQRGITGSISSPANGTQSNTTITFSPAFAATPRVVATLNWASDPGNVIAYSWIDTISTTGATIRARQNSAGSVSWTANWIAVDQ